jgi:hypothetical protein
MFFDYLSLFEDFIIIDNYVIYLGTGFINNLIYKLSYLIFDEIKGNCFLIKISSQT